MGSFLGDFGVGDAISLGGGIVNAITGRSAAKAQKEQARRQAQLIGLQAQNMRAAQPYYAQALQQYANMAGLGQNPGAAAGAEREFGLGGGFGDRNTQLRLRQAEEDINRYAQMRGGGLQSTMQRRGIADASQASALAANERGAGQDFARFRRGLALEQQQQQQQALAQLMGVIGQGFGQGAQAAAGYGQQAGMYGQQANQAFGAVGQGIQDWQQQQALQRYMQMYGVNGGQAGGYGVYGDVNGPGYAGGDVTAPVVAPAPFGPPIPRDPAYYSGWQYAR